MTDQFKDLIDKYKSGKHPDLATVRVAVQSLNIAASRSGVCIIATVLKDWYLLFDDELSTFSKLMLKSMGTGHFDGSNLIPMIAFFDAGIHEYAYCVQERPDAPNAYVVSGAFRITVNDNFSCDASTIDTTSELCGSFYVGVGSDVSNMISHAITDKARKNQVIGLQITEESSISLSNIEGKIKIYRYISASTSHTVDVDTCLSDYEQVSRNLAFSLDLADGIVGEDGLLLSTGDTPNE